MGRKMKHGVGDVVTLRCGDQLKILNIKSFKHVEVEINGNISIVSSSEINSGKIAGHCNKKIKNISDVGIGYSYKIGNVGYDVVDNLSGEKRLIMRSDGLLFTSTVWNIVRGYASGAKSHNPLFVSYDLPCNQAWVCGAENVYSVSTDGDIFSYKTGEGVKLSNKQPHNKSRGTGSYPIVNLSTSSGQKSETIHRLVAKAFIPNPENKPHVNHIDGDKSNNRVENLEWVTASENTTHAFSLGLINNSSIIESRALAGYYDGLIKQSVEKGFLPSKFSKTSADRIPDSVIIRNGADVDLFRLLVNKVPKRCTTESIIKMYSGGLSMTEISKITNYSLSAISRKINGSRK